MMDELAELDNRILETAQRLFLKEGFLNTEMRSIARELGCSRSTLYRHFADKETILFFLARNVLRLLQNSAQVPAGMQFACGYDGAAYILTSTVETMIAHVDDVTLLRDFDSLYSKEYPHNTGSEAFMNLMNTGRGWSRLPEYLQAGMEDGSIRRMENPQLVAETLSNSVIAYAERVLPRLEHYDRFYGSGCKMLREHLKIVLAGIRQS